MLAANPGGFSPPGFFYACSIDCLAARLCWYDSQQIEELVSQSQRGDAIRRMAATCGEGIGWFAGVLGFDLCVGADVG